MAVCRSVCERKWSVHTLTFTPKYLPLHGVYREAHERLHSISTHPQIFYRLVIMLDCQCDEWLLYKYNVKLVCNNLSECLNNPCAVFSSLSLLGTGCSSDSFCFSLKKRDLFILRNVLCNPHMLDFTLENLLPPYLFVMQNAHQQMLPYLTWVCLGQWALVSYLNVSVWLSVPILSQRPGQIWSLPPIVQIKCSVYLNMMVTENAS